jgi:DNA-binding winged helix-turn-helix (wHTH) protein/tetratricopeptide (TPR) repeat protein
MPADIYRFADFELDRSAYQLRRKGRPVRIERIPLDLLFLLVERPGQLVTREDMIKRIWGKDVFFDTDNSINAAVRKIRQVLHDGADTPHFVATVPTKGYRFIATLREMPDVASHRGVENRVHPRARAMVGRARELSELRAGLADATAGRGSLLLISGEPGIGKTRLSAELASLAQVGAMEVRIGQCLDREESVPYLPFVEILETCVDRTSNSRELLKLVGDEGPELARLMPRLGRLLPDLAPPIDLPPRETRRHLFNSFCDFTARLVSEQPTLFIVEDLHWADDSTLSLLDHMVKRLSKLPLLIVGTFREAEVDLSPRLAQTLEDLLRGHLASRIRLKTLLLDDVAEMLTRLSGMSPPAKVVREIYDETGGNPFFVEELFLHLKEENRLYYSSGDFRAELNIGELDAPRGVRMIVGRRLARLSDPTRSCMTTMAAIGRSFSFEVLQAASGTGADSLLESVVEAERAGLIFSSANNGKAHFEFSHELTRQAVLGSLSAALRERLHLQVAQAIEQVYCDVLEDHVSELAYHYSRSANVRKAVLYQRLAGAQAARRFAHGEAAAHLRSALEAIKSLPDSPQRSREELDLLVMLGPVVMALSGMGAAEPRAVYQRARELCRILDDNSQLFAVLWGLFATFTMNMELKEGQKIADELTSVAEQGNDDAKKLEAHHAQWNTRWHRGELSAALFETERGIALYNRPAHAALASRFGGHDAGACARFCGGILLWLMGYPDRGLTMMNEAISLARQLEHRVTLTYALHNSAMLSLLRGERDRAAEQLDAMSALVAGVPSGVIMRGSVAANPGEQEIAVMRRALTARIDSDLSLQPYFIGLTAEVCIRLNRIDDALTLLSSAFDFVNRTDERWYEAELHRLMGELSLLTAGSDFSGEEHFRRAIEVARKQTARSLELRASTSLARLLTKQGKRDEARAMLIEIYDWFIEGFDTADLKDAKALMEELNA